MPLPHPKDPSMWWRRKSTGLSSAQRLTTFSQDDVVKNGLFPEDSVMMKEAGGKELGHRSRNYLS